MNLTTHLITLHVKHSAWHKKAVSCCRCLSFQKVMLHLKAAVKVSVPKALRSPPQTKEALQHAQQAGCPIILALTKCDMLISAGGSCHLS